jgi:hypothetical protein
MSHSPGHLPRDILDARPAEVMEAAEVAEGHLAGGVDAVVAYPEVGGGARIGRVSVKAGGEGHEGGAADQGPCRGAG